MCEEMDQQAQYAAQDHRASFSYQNGNTNYLCGPGTAAVLNQYYVYPNHHQSHLYGQPSSGHLNYQVATSEYQQQQQPAEVPTTAALEYHNHHHQQLVHHHAQQQQLQSAAAAAVAANYYNNPTSSYLASYQQQQQQSIDTNGYQDTGCYYHQATATSSTAPASYSQTIAASRHSLGDHQHQYGNQQQYGVTYSQQQPVALGAHPPDAPRGSELAAGAHQQATRASESAKNDETLAPRTQNCNGTRSGWDSLPSNGVAQTAQAQAGASAGGLPGQQAAKRSHEKLALGPSIELVRPVAARGVDSSLAQAGNRAGAAASAGPRTLLAARAARTEQVKSGGGASRKQDGQALQQPNASNKTVHATDRKSSASTATQQQLINGGGGGISGRKNATRETTAMLKDWLDQHGHNPYPTKGEKIMLSIITKMSLTQVSTWFANARRRMKKEDKSLEWINNHHSYQGGAMTTSQTKGAAESTSSYHAAGEEDKALAVLAASGSKSNCGAGRQASSSSVSSCISSSRSTSSGSGCCALPTSSSSATSLAALATATASESATSPSRIKYFVHRLNLPAGAAVSQETESGRNQCSYQQLINGTSGDSRVSENDLQAGNCKQVAVVGSSSLSTSSVEPAAAAVGNYHARHCHEATRNLRPKSSRLDQTSSRVESPSTTSHDHVGGPE